MEERSESPAGRQSTWYVTVAVPVMCGVVYANCHRARWAPRLRTAGSVRGKVIHVASVVAWYWPEASCVLPR